MVAWCLAAAPTRLPSEVLPWLGALVVLVMIGAGAIAATRKWLRRDEDQTGDFSLHQLRQLHATGSLTDDEFERAKRAVIGRLKAEQPEAEAEGDQADEP